MKLELVDSISLSDKYESYNNKETKINRRMFFSLVAIGAMGVLLPTKTQAFLPMLEGLTAYFLAPVLRREKNRLMEEGYTEKEAEEEIIRIFSGRIKATVPSITTDDSILASRSTSSGNIYLANSTKKDISGNLRLTMVDEWDYKEFTSQVADYKVPSNRVQKYKFTNGPSASVKKDTRVNLVAETQIDRKKSSVITIRA